MTLSGSWWGEETSCWVKCFIYEVTKKKKAGSVLVKKPLNIKYEVRSCPYKNVISVKYFNKNPLSFTWKMSFVLSMVWMWGSRDPCSHVAGENEWGSYCWLQEKYLEVIENWGFWVFSSPQLSIKLLQQLSPLGHCSFTLVPSAVDVILVLFEWEIYYKFKARCEGAEHRPISQFLNYHTGRFGTICSL